MALTGQLSDLSLAELIEFFCNQRKTGRLKVIYPQAPGFFYVQSGSLVDAKIGDLNGVEAVYYALTLPNASFKFSPVFEASRRTIHQPWTQVVLEGLRRIDEGITQTRVFKDGSGDDGNAEDESELDEITESEVDGLEAFKANGATNAPLPMMVNSAASKGRSKVPLVAAVVVALAASVAVIGVPAGWYSKAKPAVLATPAAPSTPAPSAEEASNNNSTASQAEESKPNEEGATGTAAATLNNDAILAARREREARDRERMLRAAEERANAPATKQSDNTNAQAQTASANANPAKKTDAPRTGPKMVSVQVTYDEAGRVTQASGGDATALRVARQKRFPAGKPGSTTVTIPIN
ncbi:MAG TPA: DUF4388 domain-containing protein [Pyrinomonadaceae bacterium]|jgi:hypothetical protein|nr:DUF4388 domain-containing protein [Pyrinomonadaceae bacterium]